MSGELGQMNMVSAEGKSTTLLSSRIDCHGGYMRITSIGLIRMTNIHMMKSERFDWIRGHHVGGRSIMWGRHCYRWSDMDFEANLKDGIAVDWPIRYADIEPWYDYVETFIGVSGGQKEGLKQVPDGQFSASLSFELCRRTLS